MEACNPHGDPATFWFVGCTLEDFVELAYNIPPEQMDWRGPSWGKTDRWVIQARPTAPSSAAAMAQMLQPVLASRFGLQFRREVRQAPAYFLERAGRLKLMPATRTDHCGQVLVRPNRAAADCVSIADITEVMKWVTSRINGVDRPVFDHTGLPAAAHYRLQLTFAAAPGDDSGPSIFSALPDQLGLKLAAGHTAQRFLVVTAARRPGGN